MTRTNNDFIRNEYFEWMYGLVCRNRFSKQTSYRRLLNILHSIEFVYSISLDDNRAWEGIELRRRFALLEEDVDIVDHLDGPCSILEMMVALALHIEEAIMHDPELGDRTSQWFWGMVVSLGLGAMTDAKFDRRYVEETIATFLNHEYEPNGRGGLFTWRHPHKDLRYVEIWYQMNWYLDEILGI